MSFLIYYTAILLAYTDFLGKLAQSRQYLSRSAAEESTARHKQFESRHRGHGMKWKEVDEVDQIVYEYHTLVLHKAERSSQELAVA